MADNNMVYVNDKQQLDALVNKDVNAVIKDKMQEKLEKSFITFDPFYDYIEEGKKMEAPKELIPHILVEHETTILFGDTGLGKSTLAMQIACEVAEQGYDVASGMGQGAIGEQGEPHKKTCALRQLRVVATAVGEEIPKQSRAKEPLHRQHRLHLDARRDRPKPHPGRDTTHRRGERD